MTNHSLSYEIFFGYTKKACNKNNPNIFFDKLFLAFGIKVDGGEIDYTYFLCMSV